jgi:hypothetical protein
LVGGRSIFGCGIDRFPTGRIYLVHLTKEGTLTFIHKKYQQRAISTGTKRGEILASRKHTHKREQGKISLERRRRRKTTTATSTKKKEIQGISTPAHFVDL